jgi:hypothetical protein
MSCCAFEDGPEFSSEDFIVARKSHKCCECYTEIKPGDTYHYLRGLWDGEFMTFKTCEKCADLRDSLGDVWCVALTNLQEEYREYLSETGKVVYNEETDEDVYPENHLKLND